MQAGAQRGKGLVERGPLHGVYRVMLNSLPLAPDVGPVHDLFDGIGRSPCSDIGQNHDRDLLFLLVLVDVSLNVGQHIEATRVHWIVYQHKGVRELEVVARQLLLLALQPGGIIDAQGLAGSSPSGVHTGHVDVLNGWMQLLRAEGIDLALLWIELSGLCPLTVSGLTWP